MSDFIRKILVVSVFLQTDFSSCQVFRSQDLFPNILAPGVGFFAPPVLPMQEAHHRQTYFIAASNKIRGGQPYKIHVSVLPDAYSALDLQAAIRWNGTTLASGKQTFLPNSQDLFPLKVKTMLAEGNYELVVEGHFRDGGKASSFKHRATLQLESRSVNIVIRTDKPIYHQEEIVHVRVIPLTPQLTPYHGVVDIFIDNPDGYLQRRYPAVHSNFGVVSIAFQLAPELKFGNWKIRAQIGPISQEIEFPVEEFNQPLFEVNVTQPITILDSEEFFSGSVQANLTWGQTAVGNCTLEVFLVGPDSEAEAPNWDGMESLSQFEEYFFGVMDFVISMEELRKKAPEENLDGMILAVRATVSDYWYNETRIGYSQTKVYNSSARLTFLGDQPQVFKPGMIFTTHLGVSQQNGAPLRTPSHVEVRTQLFSESGSGGETRRAVIRVPDDGVIFLEVLIPSGVSELLFEAYDVGNSLSGLHEPYETTNASKTRMTVLRSQSFRDHIIQITSTTRNAKVGEYVILHLKASYHMNKLNWIVTSKGLVILSGQENVRSSSYAFSLAVTAEMAPKAHMVVYEVLPSGDVIAEKFTFPVDGISRNKFSLAVNHHKDYYKRTFEVVVYGDPLAFVGFSAIDRNLYPLSPGLTSLSRSDILRTLHSTESAPYGTGVHAMTFTSSDGFSDSSAYFATNTYGLDTFSMFDQADLVVFSDAKVLRTALAYCDDSAGEMACVSGGCFKEAEKCDGTWNCRDGTDEGQCSPVETLYNEMLEFRRSRFNHLDRSYAFTCCWVDGNISPEGHFIVKVPVPERPIHFVFTAISMSETSGLGVLDYHVVFDSVKPFHMIVETTDSIHQGEQVSIRCALFNYYDQEMEILIILHESEDYAFIEVGPFGTTQSYNAKKVSGTIHHSIWLDTQATTVVYMPIVPRRLGDITVTVTAITQIGESTQSRTITVIPDGVKMRFHTSIPIDLTNKGTIMKMLDIVTTENTTVPRQIERLFVLGSPKATITAAGDVFGPILDDVIDSITMLNMPHQGGEMSVFSFAMNLYALDFLRRTNQLTDVVTTKLFNALNAFYQTILNYQDYYGPFHQFMNETIVQNSVWLTTLTIQIFEESRKLLQYSDWEDYLYIDPLITEQSVRWILQHQSPEGAFFERLIAPYDRKMSYSTCQPRLEQGENCFWVENTNATLTAQVVISLKEIEASSGSLGSLTIPARMAAVRYLERVLDLLFDPYEIAIVTYALTVVDSPMKDAAFEKLDGQKRSYDGYLYWGKEQINPPGFILRNNLPYMEAHLPNKFESTNIAATSYALMIYNLRRSFLTEKIAAWLNTQRLHNTGFGSTQDTLMAVKALIHHSYFANVREATDMNITITTSSSPGFEGNLHVTRKTLSTLQSLDIPNPWGQIQAIARGSGYALLQLDVEYSVDHARYIVPPPVKAFDIDLEIIYTGKNNSILILKPCARWTMFDESPQSGMAVIEVDIPSGYVVFQPDLEDYCGQKANHLLRYAEFYDGKVSFFLDYLDGGRTCVEVLATRWFPVANQTRWLTLKVFDYYAPERFNTTIYEATPLYAQNICHVCGSFQCPYCPSYNTADRPSAADQLCIWLIFFLFFFKFSNLNFLNF